MNFSTLIHAGMFFLKKRKGLIFTGLAMATEIAAIIITAKQAPKAEKVLIPANKKVTKLKEELKDDEAIANNLIYPEEHKKEIRKIQKKTFISLAKIYAPVVALTGLSLTFIGTSYKIMRSKQLALGAAYITLDNAYKSYRNRVKDKIGEEAEQDIFRDMKDVKITRTVENPDTGEVSEIEETIRRANSGGGWELFFDATSYLWSKNGRTNWETLMAKQEEANTRLKIDGYLFLYDVLEMLLIPKTTISKDLLVASRSVGWIYDPYDPTRSSWVSFGISDEEKHPNEVGKELFDNVERDVILSFNPDGNILLDKNGRSFAFHVKD